MIKEILVTMPDNSVWSVPAEIIGRDRSDYYANKEKDERGGYDNAFKEEMDYIMNDRLDLFDWACNNMNWEDVKDYAKMIKPAPVIIMTDEDFQEGWTNGEHECVEYDGHDV